MFGGYTCPVSGPLVPFFTGEVSYVFHSQGGLGYLQCKCKGNIDLHYLRSAYGATPAGLFDGQLSTRTVPHIPLPAEVRMHVCSLRSTCGALDGQHCGARSPICKEIHQSKCLFIISFDHVVMFWIHHGFTTI